MIRRRTTANDESHFTAEAGHGQHTLQAGPSRHALPLSTDDIEGPGPEPIVWPYWPMTPVIGTRCWRHCCDSSNDIRTPCIVAPWLRRRARGMPWPAPGEWWITGTGTHDESIPGPRRPVLPTGEMSCRNCHRHSCAPLDSGQEQMKVSHRAPAAATSSDTDSIFVAGDPGVVRAENGSGDLLSCTK